MKVGSSAPAACARSAAARLCDRRGRRASTFSRPSTARSCSRPDARRRCPPASPSHCPRASRRQVRPRSGLALKHGVTVLNAPGTIDSDYRGEVKAILINHGATPFTITRGMKIAQLVDRARMRASNGARRPRSNSTARGDGGFGSTGLTVEQGKGAMLRLSRKDLAGARGGDRHRLQRASRTGAGQGDHRAPGRAAALSGTGDAAAGARRHPQGRARARAAATAWRASGGASASATWCGSP